MDTRLQFRICAFFCAIIYVDSISVSRNPESCGGVIKATKGAFTSPSFPDLYPLNIFCLWDIIAPPEYRITLHFTHFDLDGENGECDYDKVIVRNKKADGNFRKYGVFCGSGIPPLISSESNSLRVEFRSGLTTQKTGFRALFFADKDECAVNNGGCEHVCNKTIGSYSCSCYSGFVLDENLHDCKDEDECAINNGKCQHICNNTVGNYTCSCRSGFRLHKNLHDCEDEDECAINNGRCQHICNNAVGNYNCSCRSGFRLHENLHDCEALPRPPTNVRIDNVDANVIALSWSYDTGSENIIYYVVQYKPKQANQAYEEKSGITNMFCNFRSLKPNTEYEFYVIAVNSVGRGTPSTAIVATTVDTGSCESKMISSNGVIISPNYPNHYPSGLKCGIRGSIKPGHRFKVVFEKFELEDHPTCAFDYLAIYDGDSFMSPMLGKFCGTEVPQPILTSGNSMLLTFDTDITIENKGFKATYTTVCGSHLLADHSKQYFYSHLYYSSEKYESGAECDWIVKGLDDQRVKVEFVTFELQQDDICSFDYIEVYDGEDDSAKSFGRFCGNKVPPEFYSSGDSLMIRFRSDDSENYEGFVAAYTILDSSIDK